MYKLSYPYNIFVAKTKRKKCSVCQICFAKYFRSLMPLFYVLKGLSVLMIKYLINRFYFSVKTAITTFIMSKFSILLKILISFYLM